MRAQSEAGAFPWWEDEKRLVGCMRATGLRTTHGPLLAIESIERVTAQSAVRRSVYAYRLAGESGCRFQEWLPDVAAEPELPGLELAITRLHRLSPAEVSFLRACEDARSAFLSDVARLADDLRLERPVTTFVFDDWEHPSTETFDPGKSPDIVAMCEAIETGRELKRLPGKANGTARHWLPSIVAARTEIARGWGVGPKAKKPSA